MRKCLPWGLSPSPIAALGQVPKDRRRERDTGSGGPSLCPHCSLGGASRGVSWGDPGEEKTFERSWEHPGCPGLAEADEGLVFTQGRLSVPTSKCILGARPSWASPSQTPGPGPDLAQCPAQLPRPCSARGKGGPLHARGHTRASNGKASGTGKDMGQRDLSTKGGEEMGRGGQGGGSQQGDRGPEPREPLLEKLSLPERPSGDEPRPRPRTGGPPASDRQRRASLAVGTGRASPCPASEPAQAPVSLGQHRLLILEAPGPRPLSGPR